MSAKEDISMADSKTDPKHLEQLSHDYESDLLLSGKDPRIKAIKRKTDLRICLVLGILYTMAAIDRVNLPNASVPHETPAQLVRQLTNILILVFFPFYICFQPPMTAIARKVGPRLFITFIVISWGIVMVCHGLVKTWRQMIALRCLLGMLEAGYFSTAAYLVSTWYIRREVATRNSAFYLFGSLLGGFGGILAYGLSHMNGVGGYSGWRWILIMEGVITVALGIPAYFLIVDFPEEAPKSWKFINEEESKLIVDRINLDRRDVVIPPFNMREYLSHGKDWKVWFFAINFCMTSVVNYAVAYFLPIVLRDELGFSVAQAQCLNAPCYVFAIILGVSLSRWSDKINLRAPFFLLNCFLEVIGVCVLGFAKPSGVRYFGAFLIVGPAFANIPFSLTYQANNILGQWKRAYCSALIVGAGGVGGIIGSLVFRTQDAPSYRPGLYSCLVAIFLCVVSMCTTTVYFYRQNKLQAEGKIIIEGEEGFRYTY
ncbi:hypothetical protein AJ78_03639 [Emergomyces pasteurianus Ep9510]|uniref:Major facilitator superfamily (MFS) profile domain-containing protein n=1 Tax=Emergomyces pasteurianus Ep9510 TaxID=1447872 RepID=A0A1J9QJ46_9EURO|nr:hypothetical protein AJ78_03639 [Emergomyces pasteurianus Ep9510]